MLLSRTPPVCVLDGLTQQRCLDATLNLRLRLLLVFLLVFVILVFVVLLVVVLVLVVLLRLLVRVLVLRGIVGAIDGVVRALGCLHRVAVAGRRVRGRFVHGLESAPRNV
jgi:hypothetical protein